MVKDIKIDELVAKYKLHQGFTDGSFDDVIRMNITGAIQYIVNAGVSEKQINAGEADFAIIRGAADMWESDRFTRMFFMLVTQLRASKGGNANG